MNPFDDEDCPHCDEPQPPGQMDAHIAAAHADLPPCRAFIETEHRETYRCAFRAGHAKGKYGKWHASTREEAPGRYVWNDSHRGATPHRAPEPRLVGLDHFKAMGAISHTIVAAGEDRTERPFGVACAVLHTDAQGKTIPCPGYPHASGTTPDRLSLPSGDPDCPQLLRKVPHDAHGYEGRHCHGVSLSDDDGSPEPPSEAELNDALPVRPDPRQPAYDAVYEYIRKLGGYLPPDPVHRNAVIWRAVNAALGATSVGRCVSSHCVEGDHIVPVDGESEAP